MTGRLWVERSIFLSQIFWASTRRASSRLLAAPVLRRASRKRSLIAVSEQPSCTAIVLAVCPEARRRRTSSSRLLRLANEPSGCSLTDTPLAHHRHPETSIPIILGSSRTCKEVATSRSASSVTAPSARTDSSRLEPGGQKTALYAWFSRAGRVAAFPPTSDHSTYDTEMARDRRCDHSHSIVQIEYNSLICRGKITKTSQRYDGQAVKKLHR